MGCCVFRGTPCAKGPVLYWLDQCSVGPRARECLTAFLNEIRRLGPAYDGLENVVDSHLASVVNADARVRESMREHLRVHWFGDGSDAYFPGQNMARKWAEAVMKTLELSLGGQPDPVPINSWWIIEADQDVRMLNLSGVDKGRTVSSSVTLLICTPLPPPTGAPTNRSLWGDADAWLTEGREGAVITRWIDKESRPDQ